MMGVGGSCDQSEIWFTLVWKARELNTPGSLIRRHRKLHRSGQTLQFGAHGAAAAFDLPCLERCTVKAPRCKSILLGRIKWAGRNQAQPLHGTCRFGCWLMALEQERVAEKSIRTPVNWASGAWGPRKLQLLILSHCTVPFLPQGSVLVL